mgnify:CR=1 FL=1|jgi:hypothetical protein
MRRRVLDDGSYIYEPSNLDRARFYTDIPYFFSGSFDPNRLGDITSEDFDERGSYIIPDNVFDENFMRLRGLNEKLPFADAREAFDEMIFDDDPENEVARMLQDDFRRDMARKHPYNFYRDRILSALDDLSMEELSNMTGSGYQPHKELLRDMRSFTPNPRSWHEDTQEMFLPKRNVAMKNLPKSIMDIISPSGPSKKFLENVPQKVQRGFRDRGKRVASLEAAVAANRRMEALNEANQNVRENILQSFFPTIPRSYGNRPYSMGSNFDMVTSARTFQPDRYGGAGANPPRAAFTFDEDDEASAVIMNEAFPEQFQLINRSEDAFEDAWALMKIESPEYQGHHQAPVDEDYHAPLHDMTRIYPEDLYSNMGVHYYGDGSHDSREMDSHSHRIIMSVRGDPEANVIVYRAVPYEVGGEINPGDWVSTSRIYAVNHGRRFGHGEHGPGGFRLLKREVKAKDLFSEGNSLHEYGWRGDT